MDHAEAQQKRAAERYALGDLSVSEVEDFERHFFDCPQCSEELRLLAVLQDNARAVFIEPRADVAEQSPAPSPVAAVADLPPERVARAAKWWNTWVIAAPALAMLAAALYVGYLAGGRKAGDPQAVGAFPLYAASRGAETVISPEAGAQFYTLYMDRTWDHDFASYRAVVRDDTGSAAGGDGSLWIGTVERVSMPVPAPAPGHAIYVLLPVRALAPGRYVLAILGKDSGAQETKAAEYRFTLRFPVN
jgi:hypothetical protein